MKDLCHDIFGIAKEKKDPREVMSNRGISYHCVVLHSILLIPTFLLVISLLLLLSLLKEIQISWSDLLDVLPEKRKPEDGGYLSDEGPNVLTTTLSN